MPTNNVLETAGERAAFRPVPFPQPVDSLAAEVARRRTKRRRVVGGALTVVALVAALPIGAALIDDDQPDVVTLASPEGDAGSAQAAFASQLDEPTTTTSPSTTTTTVADGTIDRGPFAGLSDEDFDLRLDLGDIELSISIIGGDDADERAEKAESDADKTRDVDGQSIWIDERGDDIAASALFDETTFVEVVGPRDQIERILDLVVEHANGPVMFFDHDGFAERFDLPEGVFDENFPFGEHSPFGKDFPFEEGTPFFGDENFEDFRKQMEEFSTCMEVTVDRSGSTTKIEIPDCEFPEIDGLFGGDMFESDLFKDFPADLEDLFGEVEDALEDAEVD